MTVRNTSAQGFTLIEVLISLAIFALAAVVLSMAYLNIIGSYSEMGGRQQAEEDWKWLRLSVLFEPDRKKIEDGGRLALPDGQQLVWTAKIEPTEVADLFRVDLKGETAQTTGPEAWQRHQSLQLLRPAWSDPAERDKLRDVTRQRLAKQRSK
jgi:general secretion pathway protein I